MASAAVAPGMQQARGFAAASTATAPSLPLARPRSVHGLSRQQVRPAPEVPPSPQQRLVEDPAPPSTSGRGLTSAYDWQTAVAALQAQQDTPVAASEVVGVLQLIAQQVEPQLLNTKQRQQLDVALQHLCALLLEQLAVIPRQQSAEAVQLLVAVGARLPPTWVRAVLQHAATDLHSYTPSQLVTFLKAATRAAQQQRLRERALQQQQQQQQQQGVGATTTTSSSSSSVQREQPVVTGAWLTHFMATFEKFLSHRVAHPELTPRDMEEVVRCLTALGATPDKSWLYLYVRQLSAQIGDCPPASLVGIVSTLGQLGYQLPDHVATQFERQVGAHLRQLRPAELAAALAAFAHIRHKPSESWVRSLLTQALRGSVHLNASAVVGLMAGAAALGHHMEHGWIDLLMLQIRHLLAGFTPHEHVGLIESLSQQHYRPAQSFMADYMTAVQQRLPELSLEQVAVLLGALGQVGYKPSPQWMRGTMLQLLQRPVSPSDAPTFLRLLGALRRMAYTPSADILAGLEGRIDGIAVQLLYPQVQELRAALAALEYVPPVPAAMATAEEEEQQQQEAASPAAVLATAEGAVLAATAGVEGSVLGSSSAAVAEAAVAAAGAGNGTVSATLADRFVVAAGAVAAAAAASAAAPVQ